MKLNFYISWSILFLEILRLNGFLYHHKISSPKYIGRRNFNSMMPRMSSAIVGHAHTLESRAKISAANKGKTPWNLGRQHSEETRKKIAEKTKLAMQKLKHEKIINTGLSIQEYDNLKSEVAKEKRKQRNKGGITVEGRKKISDSLKKRWENPEFRTNYTMYAKGNRNHSAETRAKIAESIRLKWQNQEYRNKFSRSPSVEAREKISATLKAKWEDPIFRNKMTSSFTERSDSWRKTVSEKIKEKWNDPVYREKVSTGIKNSLDKIYRYKNITIESTENHKSNAKNKISINDFHKARENESKRLKMKENLKLLEYVKNLVKSGALNGKKIKDFLGKKLWLEQKIMRKKDSDYSLIEDVKLESILLQEWSSGIRLSTDSIDDIYFEDDDHIDVIEVYDENGELVGSYTEKEYNRFRKFK